MSDERIEILKSGYQAFSETNTELLNTQENLNDKAIDLLKVVILLGSLLATLVTITDVSGIEQYLLAVSLFLIVAAIFCIATFTHTKTYRVGVSEEARDMMLQQNDAEEHYRDLLKAYSNCVKRFNNEYETEKKYFQTALESVLIAMVLFLVGASHQTASDLYGFSFGGLLSFLAILLAVAISAVRWGSRFQLTNYIR